MTEPVKPPEDSRWNHDSLKLQKLQALFEERQHTRPHDGRLFDFLELKNARDNQLPSENAA